MTQLSLPAYTGAKMIDPDSIPHWSDALLLKGYLIINCSFKFPSNTKYPSIPCYVDKTTTVYPLEGQALLTGPEYLLARNQLCEIKIKNAYYTPATEVDVKIGGESMTVQVFPFQEIINELQAKRREFPKGHIMNSLYKELGNSIYGNVVRGISNKKSFDSKTGKMNRVAGTELSNPILASWTTAFIRSVIGECLHNIHKLGGKVVSVTTDGFITNLPDLEQKLSNLDPKQTPLLNLFRNLRVALTNEIESPALELKYKSEGIVS
jgi:hypothetical protein